MLKKIRNDIATWLNPDLVTKDQVEELIEQAQQSIPISINRDDPKGEGYRKIKGNQNIMQDLSSTKQSDMLNYAYYMYDTSGFTRRFVRDTKNFILGDGFTYSVTNDDDGKAKDILNEFYEHPQNRLDMLLENRIEFLFLLGEQLWPVSVNRITGQVLMSYIDPSAIDTVETVKDWPEIPGSIKLLGNGGRPGDTLAAIRTDFSIMNKKTYGRLVGEAFYFSINKPPNGSRGRSDLLPIFDFLEAMEDGLFNELDRVKALKSFIWDVTLKGKKPDEVLKWLDEHGAPPEFASLRAHNDNVEWKAVSPDLKIGDHRGLFDLLKMYLAACVNRPDSWFGGGGKAYQNEADLMGEPTFKDLASRQRYVKYMLEYVFKFVLDQAIIHKQLSENKKKPYMVVVDMPELSSKDLGKTTSAMQQIVSALGIAVEDKLVTIETAAKLFASVASQVGVEVDAEKELEAIKKNVQDNPSDYNQDPKFISNLVDRLKKEIEGAEEHY